MRALVFFALVSTTAFAADLKPKQAEAKAAFDTQMKDLVAEVNEACGTAFTEVKADFEHYDKANFPQMPPGQTCSTLTYAAKTVCKTEAYKAAFKSSIKGLACTMKAGAKPFDFTGGVATFNMVGPKLPNGIEATDALKAELDK